MGMVRFNDAESASEAIGFSGMEIDGCEIQVEMHPKSVDGTIVRVSGLPAGMPGEALKSYMESAGEVAHAKVFDQDGEGGAGETAIMPYRPGGKAGKGTGKAGTGNRKSGGGTTSIGEVRFNDPESAEAAVLGLDETEIDGCTISVKPDPRSSDGTKIRVTGLPAGLRWQVLKEQMELVAPVVHCKVFNQGDEGGAEEDPAGEGKGKGKDKGPSGPDLPRERITEEPLTGSLINWKGKSGFIEPHEVIDHPLARRRGGKIYVHMKDFKQRKKVPAGGPELGTEVQFHLYQDESGLGAEEVVIL